MAIHSIEATANIVQFVGGVGDLTWSVMSVYVPHEKSKRAAEGSEEFMSTIGKAGTQRRSHLLAGDLNWYCLREWHDEKNGEVLSDDIAATVRWKNAPGDRDITIWNAL